MKVKLLGKTTFVIFKSKRIVRLLVSFNIIM